MGPQNWFVVINRKSAKVFEVSDKPQALTYLRTIRNPLGAIKNKLMRLDKPGFSRGKFVKNKSPHALTHEKNPQEDSAIDFAKKLAHYLRSHKLNKNYLNLIIAAEPHMMGLVRKAIEHDHFKVNIRWLQKDLEKMSTERLETMLFS